jgi:purine-binding chemotaxis protein CheW
MSAVKAEQQEIDNAATLIGMSNNDDQYLTFILDNEEYGIDILRVQEIKGWDRVTRIPNTPEFVQGVINLRGSIVPIIDLRQRFNIEKLEYGPTTVVIVLRVQDEDSDCIMGVVVDAVSDVYNIAKEQLREIPPSFSSSIMESVRCIATVNEKMVILLDVDHLLNADELTALGSIDT